MRNLKLLCLSLIFLGSSAFAGPKDDAYQVVERWAKVSPVTDPDAFSRCFDHAA